MLRKFFIDFFRSCGECPSVDRGRGVRTLRSNPSSDETAAAALLFGTGCSIGNYGRSSKISGPCSILTIQVWRWRYNHSLSK